LGASDFSERAKAEQIERLVKESTSNGKPKSIKVVVAEGSGRGPKAGVKGIEGS